MIGSFPLTTLLIALVGSAAEEPLLRKPHKKKKAVFMETVPPEQPTCNTCPTYDNKDLTNRVGLGESPGIPNLEYLGLGYNIFEGNPRGSDITEIDPGFRSRVVKLRQEQTTLTIDQEYMVPLGVDVRYITACKFASEATELSNESEYRSEISKETTQKTEYSGGVSSKLFSVSGEYAFSSSSKYKEFVDTSRATQTVTYEARALCSEFKASLKPYYSHVFDDRFEMALNNLPYPYEKSNETHTREYKQFLDSFGTHYISDVTLGAKHVFSSIMKSDDVSELLRSDIDISSSLSWSVQASFGAGGQGNADYGTLVRSEAEIELKPGGPTAKTYSYVFEETSVGGMTSEETTSSEESSESNLNKVRSKVTTVKELNVGGNPPEDGNWKTWATTVRDRPMPISYELEGIWNLMADEINMEAFKDAIIEIYNIDIRARKDSTIIDALRFGVARGDGKAISSYNRVPSSNYRSNLRLTAIPGTSIELETTGDIVGELSDIDLDVVKECKGGTADWKPFKGPDSDFGGFACGMEARTDSSIDAGITGLTTIYCNTDNWRTQISVVSNTNGDTSKSKVMCDEYQFIVGVEVKADQTGGDNQGIDGLWITCATVPDTTETAPVETKKQVYNDDSTYAGATKFEKKRSSSILFMSGARVRYCNGLGILGIDIEFSEPAKEGNRYASYEYDVSREGDEILAIFASTVRRNVGENKHEDEKELGFVVPSEAFESDILNILSYNPFGLMGKNSAKIVIQDFKEQFVNNKNLQSFSFLSAKNLPAAADYVAGVVHPDGYPVNDNFMDDNNSMDNDIGFKITKISKREFHVGFQNSMINQTFIMFPLWFPGFDNNFPKNIGEVVAATSKCDETGCYVVTGTNESPFAKNYLGFSFVALRGDVNPERVSGITHGVVTVSTSSDTAPVLTSSEYYNGFDAEAIFSDGSSEFEVRSGDNNENTIKFTGYSGGVLVKFDKPFQGLPSVIVNPIIGDRELTMGGETDQIALPYAVVEHITEESAFVKVDWVDTLDTVKTYEPISFHFVAVGPQRDPYLPDTRII